MSNVIWQQLGTKNVMLSCWSVSFCHAGLLSFCHAGLLSFCNAGLLSCCHAGLLSCCHSVYVKCLMLLIGTCWTTFVIFHRYEVTFLYVKCLILILGTWQAILCLCLGSKLIYLICHLPWLKVIFHHYEVIFLCVKCSILILGTCQGTFVFMPRLKTHLFSLSSLSSSMAKDHLLSLWGHLPMCQVLNIDPWDMASNFCFHF